MLKRVISCFIFSVFFVSQITAQEDPQMAEALRESGKIYVVVLCLLIIFVGLFSYLIVLDRKFSKKIKDKNE